MTALNVLPLHADFAFDVAAPFVPPEAVMSRVDEIWIRERESRGDRLTNGTIYSLDAYHPSRLTLRPTEYRLALARRLAPDLADAGLAVRPVAVTGVLLCADGLVLGRRGDHVAADAGLWEPAPAGGLARPDPVAQILEELREELGIEASRVEAPEACGIVEDGDSGVVDIVFRLRTAVGADIIRASHAAHGTDEYSALAIVPPKEVTAFLRTNHDRVLPALGPMLEVAA